MIGVLVRYWPTRSETFVAREVAALRARGLAVDVAAIGSRGDGDPLDVPDVRPPRIPVPRALGRREGLRALRWLLRRARPKDALRALAVADEGARRGWTRVHAHFAGEAAEWAHAVATVLGVPFSVTVHAVDLFVPRPSLAEVLRAARPVITVCRHHQAAIRQVAGVDAVVVRTGVPVDVPRADPGGPGLHLVSVARDVPKKGLDDLVAAARAVGAPLRLVSDAVRLGGPGVLAGPLPPERVPAVLARARAFALACRVAPDGDRDGLPVAILEAMAAGLPVIASAVAGVPEVVDDAVGWLVPPDDPAALRRALSAARDPAERARRGRAARERVVGDRWTLDRQVDELLAAWQLRVATSAE